MGSCGLTLSHSPTSVVAYAVRPEDWNKKNENKTLCPIKAILLVATVEFGNISGLMMLALFQTLIKFPNKALQLLEPVTFVLGNIPC